MNKIKTENGLRIKEMTQKQTGGNIMPEGSDKIMNKFRKVRKDLKRKKKKLKKLHDLGFKYGGRNDLVRDWRKHLQ